MSRTEGFDVSGKHYTLKYDFNAISDIEEVAGMGIPALASSDKLGINTMRVVIWGGLKWRNQGLTKQATGILLQLFIDEGGDVTDLFNRAVSLINEAMGNKAVSEEDKSENDMGNAQTEV